MEEKIEKFGEILGEFFCASLKLGNCPTSSDLVVSVSAKLKALTSKIGCTVTQQLEFRTKNTLDPFHHGQT